MMTPFQEYLASIKKKLAQGDSTEQTHRPALETLLEAVGKGITATNEPKRIACGAPDFGISRNKVPVGHVETKDIGVSLNDMERGKGPNGEQFKRYRDALPNWILTDYLEFRWFVAGEKRLTVRIADLDGQGRIVPTTDGADQLGRLLDSFFTQPALTIGTFAQGSDSDKKWLQSWLTAFQEVLIPDLDEKQFADMFAQTLAYGLFAAKVHSGSGKDFSRDTAARCLPKTNPFLRKLFEEFAGVSMPETFDWAVDDIVELLKHAAMDEILKDFGKGQGKEDPVVHFYETFLTAYDPKMRELRGVYYTPEPVVSYIVRSIDHLLKTRFDRPKGLADENTLILDPATGTATFLYFVIRQIYQQFASQRGAWDSYVSQHLLNRLFGFELLMAPYAIAHLKLGMELQETGYTFGSDQRLGIYLTNTLEEAAKKSDKLIANWISDEANEAAEIKRDKPILVVLGNPPYSGHSANRSEVVRELTPGDSYKVISGGPLRQNKTIRVVTAKKAMTVREKTFIGDLIDDYKVVDDAPLVEKNPKWLQDDYVKFIRFAQWRIEKTGYGVLGFVTNHGYLDNPTFRGMRQSLMRSFSDIHVYDLHGNSKKKEKAPDGGKDENVFDIQQGVAIILAVKERGKSELARVYHGDLWGLRESKYRALAEAGIDKTEWMELVPQPGSYFFVPQNRTYAEEYEEGWSITSILPVNSVGIATGRDHLTIHWSPAEVWSTVQDFVGLGEEEARTKYALGKDAGDWKVRLAQADLLSSGPDQKRIVRVLYRPFDTRFTYYTGRSRGFLCRPRPAVMRHQLSGPNVALITSRMTKGEKFRHCQVTRDVSEVIVMSPKTSNNGFLFPLYLFPLVREGQQSQGSLVAELGVGRQPNLNPLSWRTP